MQRLSACLPASGTALLFVIALTAVVAAIVPDAAADEQEVDQGPESALPMDHGVSDAADIQSGPPAVLADRRLPAEAVERPATGPTATGTTVVEPVGDESAVTEPTVVEPTVVETEAVETEVVESAGTEPVADAGVTPNAVPVTDAATNDANRTDVSDTAVAPDAAAGSGDASPVVTEEMAADGSAPARNTTTVQATEPENGSAGVTEPDSGPSVIELFGNEVVPGEKRRLTWYPDPGTLGISIPTPILVAHGLAPGPVLCLTGAIHGDELNGVEMIRRLLLDLNTQELNGTVIGIPIVNTFGFLRSSRYLPDRRDLNRFFPGNPTGSAASRLAAALFDGFVRRCSVLVDIHTGSFHRTNLPQVRADLTNEAVLSLTRDFGATTVLHSRGPRGSLRRAATDIGIPAVTFEAGEPLRFQPDEVAHGVKALESLLRNLEMVASYRPWRGPQPVYYDSSWVRVNSGGILLTKVDLGDLVETGALLATVTDPINNTVQELHAPYAGRVLGMALNQAVMPGFAAIHLGRATSEAEAVNAAQGDRAMGDGVMGEDPDDDMSPPDLDGPIPDSESESPIMSPDDEDPADDG